MIEGAQPIQRYRICVLCGKRMPVVKGWTVRHIYGLRTLVCPKHKLHA